MYVGVCVAGSKHGGGGVVLRVRNQEVARQRRGRHVLLQGFLTSAQNMMLLFMQVNLSTSTQTLIKRNLTSTEAQARSQISADTTHSC